MRSIIPDFLDYLQTRRFVKNLDPFVKKSRGSEMMGVRGANVRKKYIASNVSGSYNHFCSFGEKQIMVTRGIPLHA